MSIEYLLQLKKEMIEQQETLLTIIKQLDAEIKKEKRKNVRKGINIIPL